MYSTVNILGLKKLFLFAIIFIFVTGCSSTKSILGPSDGDSDMEDAIDEHEANLEHERNMADDDGGDVDFDDLMDDMAAEDEHERNMADDDGGDSDMEDAIDEHEANLEHERNMEDNDSGDVDFDDLMDDIAADQEHEKNMEDDGDSDGDMEDAMDEHEANLEHEANMEDDGVLDDVNTPEEERRGGSCNAIEKTSTCIDYIGSFWTETQMKYACSYSGTFSFEKCETGSIGGCNVGKGSFNDMTIWMYPYGGSPISSDTVESAKPSCDMNPMGAWVNAR